MRCGFSRAQLIIAASSMAERQGPESSMKKSDGAALPEFMIAARLHRMGEALQLDRLPVPDVRPNDVLVEVKVCGVVPNLLRVMGNYFGSGNIADPKLYPRLPAIFGLDPTGVIAKAGAMVDHLNVGDRVYVNPARGCGSCRMCRTGNLLDCPQFTFQGYFGRSQMVMESYPYGGLSQFLTAPATAIVKLPDSVKYEEAARLGYLGTAYSAMKKIGVGPGRSLLINGISGTLGLCAAILGLAMGADRILGTGRNRDLLERVKAISPKRIFVHAVQHENPTTAGLASDPLLTWTRSIVGDAGVDCVLDCMPPGAPASALRRAVHTLRRGGKAANVGAITENLDLNTFWMMTNRIGLEGSVWFTTAEGEEMVAMAEAGSLDLSIFDHRTSPLSKVNEALKGMSANRDGGFANYMIDLTAVG